MVVNWDHPYVVKQTREIVKAIVQEFTACGKYSDLRWPNMNRYFKTRTELARFVKEQLPQTADDLPWTMIIKPGKYVGFYVTITTIKSSADIGKDVS